MTALHDYLRARLETGGFSTEDTLASFLPLVRAVLDAHAAGKVAPLEGLDALHVDGARIWFEDSKRREPRNNAGEVRRVETSNRAGVEIVTEQRHLTEVGEEDERFVDLAIGDRDTSIMRPVYLPGYVAWEHQLGHHDPLTDVFSLGMILASLACGLDFAEPEDLRRFVAGRRNLFAIGKDIHPVLARAIVRMTELDRHRRVQDLPPLLHSLANYRDQDVDFEFDLASVPGFVQQDNRSKQHVVLSKLQERLFEISRRNRLLHFRPTLHTVNLTHASVPLSFDIKNIRPDQILVWNRALHDAVCGGRPISLNKYLNFAEVLYLPSVLDRIIAEARRDRAEFGFAQLRLVICFLHWANLKEQPIERYDSPLVLLPVGLERKKGIRDTYLLEASSTEAEINPVVRHQFKQLYAIDLPPVIDLAKTSLDQFFDYLAGRIKASNGAVTLNKVERPRISLVYDKARRKLDQYRRRARLAGRGVRSLMDVDYSYDPANYHPLGITLFSAKIRPSSTHLREIIEERPRPRTYAVPQPETPSAEKEQSFFTLQDGGEDNPYVWNFDLCSVTLGNFKYRKMSLVRDYEALLERQPSNPAFESIFSIVPRPISGEVPPVPPLEDRYDVVSCDPTQAIAIKESHAGHSYIIQGPPGTGKSQTITNLIADYVARGKRVLFVCEKRAAIDVVFARLRQCGLGDLCCLIHDSQTDKKAFVTDLKQTYEGIRSAAEGTTHRNGRRRSTLIKRLRTELDPLERFDAAMQDVPEQVGIPLRQLLDRCIELREWLPDLSPLDMERLPDYATWLRNRERIDSIGELVREICHDGVLAHHPLSLLSPRLAGEERPLETVTSAIQAARGQLDRIEETLGRCGIPNDVWTTPARARILVDYVRRVLPITQTGQLPLLDPKNPQSTEFIQAIQQFRLAQEAVVQAAESTKAWRQRLPAEEVPTAIEQARSYEGQVFAWLRPGWWRLRSIMRRSYDFRLHLIRPSWVQVLLSLEKEYALLRDVEQQRKAIAQRYAIHGDVDLMANVIAGLQAALREMPDWIRRIHDALLGSDKAPRIVERASQADGPLRGLAEALQPVVRNHDACSFEQLRSDLDNVVGALDDLPAFLDCMREVAAMPAQLSDALQMLPLRSLQIEAATADHCLQAASRAQRNLGCFSGTIRSQHVSRLEQCYDEWLHSNAFEIRQRLHRRFLDSLHLATLPAAQLTGDQKELRRRYNHGRRELEHEFGKSMRYRSIRDLVSDESGDVVKDLKPVWLMSPLSVSDTLPLNTTYFDVVIFDEASQITLEEAIPSVFRAHQAIVVGDEMQLPPTDFFSTKRGDEDEEELLVEGDGELIQYDLESNSFLNYATRNLPSTMLGWHYRSRSESLISYSNWTFYDGRLLTVPEESLPASSRPPLQATKAADAEVGATEVLARSISFHFMEQAVYDNRRNHAEADYIAHLVRGILRRETDRSIGIIAFSEAQQDEIEGALARLAQEDAEFGNRLEAEQEREVDGQFVGLLVKNLENIQGDERDIIVLSICYGYGPNGKMRMNFGPINKSGGEKRLNVAFSRAKHHMALVSSIRFGDITNDYNDGANCLRNYLRYAEAVSTGDTEAARRVLRGASRWDDPEAQDDGHPADPVAEQVAEALIARGYQVDRAVGQSHFRCDLAVRRKGENVYRLGVLVDNEAYFEQTDLLERDMMRPRLLRDFGWKVTFVLGKDWYENKAAVVERLVKSLEGEAGEIEDPGADNVTLDEDDLSGEDAEGDPESGASLALSVSTEPAEKEPPLVVEGPGQTAQTAPEMIGVGSCSASVVPARPIAAGQTRYFQCTAGTSNKFWEIAVSDNRCTVRFGRIGTSGQTRSKEFDNVDEARNNADRLIRSKLTKGYRER